MKNIIIIMILVSFLGFVSCEDDLPSTYIPQTFVEGYMIVDEPIKNIILMKSQPIQDTFRFMESLISDADVYIKFDDKEIKLKFSDDPELPGYYYEDTDYLVEPQKTYSLEIKLKDSEDLITGETTTPKRIFWIDSLKPVLQYPIDSLNPGNPDSLVLSWTPARVNGKPWFLIRSRNNDTLEYGKYLSPSTGEMNRRITTPFRGTRGYKDVTKWTFLLNTEVNLVWTWFKWYGKNDLKIYAPDPNYQKWFLQFMRYSEVIQGVSSVENALGVFGSASTLSAPTFLVKNQP
jgi:uncharacterized protein DUF4249